jgi:riboflavin synthase
VCATQLLIFVLQVMSSQAMITVLQENEEGDHGEESAFIILGRCHKNSEKNKKIIKQ